MSRDSVADVKIHEVNGKEVRDLLAGLGLSQYATMQNPLLMTMVSNELLGFGVWKIYVTENCDHPRRHDQ